MSTMAISKKLMLWSVLFIKICFILSFWVLQIDYSSNLIQLGKNTSEKAAIKDNSHMSPQNLVNFITKSALKQQQFVNKKSKHIAIHKNVNNFENDFYEVKIAHINKTSKEYEMAWDVIDENVEPLWCYRAGTINDTQSARDNEIFEFQKQCKCLTGWHGKNCAQPEIIWRALIAHSNRKSNNGDSNMALQMSRDVHPNTPVLIRRLFYMLELNYISVELLELQIFSVIEVVDFFLIYYINNNSENSVMSKKKLERTLLEIIKNSNFIVYYCQQSKQGKCNTSSAYKYLRQQLNAVYGKSLKSTDLIVYNNDTAILKSQSLKYLKYYALDVLPLRFRLKYNVYGFFWQHPQLTQLSCVISSLIHLDSPQYGRNDPKRLYLPAGDTLTIGDLNHFGGWYCQYCRQPEEIVAELQQLINSSSIEANQIKFPSSTRNHYIDAAYLQQLIARGIYTDGETKLLKRREYEDKYYAPQYAHEQSAKFGHLIINLYETLDDIEDDAENFE